MPVTDPQDLFGATVLGVDGSKLGKVDEIYFDNQTDRPEWVAVKTGLLGSSVSLVPLAAAERTKDGLRVSYDKDQIKEAPHHDPGQELSQTDEAQLFDYYGVPYSGATVTAAGGPQAGTGAGRESAAVGRDTSGRTTNDAMTRSEERLRVGTENVEAGRARLRKYVVTENVAQTVPVTREEVRVEREPITEANRDQALSGEPISEEEHEVVLHEERPVVATETVPVERVRLAKEQVTGEETVGGEVRKEQIETRGVTDTKRGRRRR